MGKGVKAICRIKNVRVTEMSGYSHLHGTGPFVGQQTIVLKKYQEFSFSGNSLRRRGGGGDTTRFFEFGKHHLCSV